MKEPRQGGPASRLRCSSSREKLRFSRGIIGREKRVVHQAVKDITVHEYGITMQIFGKPQGPGVALKKVSSQLYQTQLYAISISGGGSQSESGGTLGKRHLTK